MICRVNLFAFDSDGNKAPAGFHLYSTTASSYAELVGLLRDLYEQEGGEDTFEEFLEEETGFVQEGADLRGSPLIVTAIMQEEYFEFMELSKESERILLGGKT